MSEEYKIMNNPFGSLNYDPIHALFIKKKQMEKDGEIDLTPKHYNEDDMYELESFCKKYGIVGANFGNMSPKSTLKMLKSKMGIVEEPIQVQTKVLLKG